MDRHFRYFITTFIIILSASMASQLDLNIRIRTEQSDEYSMCGSEYAGIQHSIDSISIIDESVSLHIQKLQRMEEEKRERSKKSVSSRSHSYIHIEGEQNEEKKKYKSMKGKLKPDFSIQNVPHATMSMLLSYHRCLNLAKSDLYNRAYGAMFGFLIGDSMGSHIINRSFNEQQILQALMMKGGGVMNLKPGEGTDEWQIGLALSEGLIECGDTYDSNKIAMKYLEWIDSKPIDFPVLMGISFSDINKKRRETGRVNFSTIGNQLRYGSLKNLKHQSYLGLIRIIPLTIWGLQLEQYQFNHIIREQLKFITPNQFVVQSCIIFANILKCILTTGDHMLAFHEASQIVYKFGSEKMIELWGCIEDDKNQMMSNTNASNLKFPFVYAINQMLEVDERQKDLKKVFINSAIRTLSKGFNTDTNCSIVLGLVGAIIGYNNIPSYFRNKILNCEGSLSTTRGRDYHPKRIVDVVANLLKSGPTHLQDGFL